MKSQPKRLIFVMLAVLAIASMLAACGGGQPAAQPTAAPAAPAAQPTTAPAAEQPTAAPAAVQPTAEPANKALVGVVLPTKDEPRWLQDQAVFQKAGWDPLFSQGDSAKEKANVEALISQGIKVLIICPQDATAAAAAAQDAPGMPA